MKFQNISKKIAISGLIASSMVVGGAGMSILNAVAAHAQTTITPTVVTAQVATPAATSAPVASNLPSGLFKSNENSAHEATESPAREAQEDAGQMPTVK